nr:MAG TPA: hypothetical protein [Caudoviricetes sp.]
MLTLTQECVIIGLKERLYKNGRKEKGRCNQK